MSSIALPKAKVYARAGYYGKAHANAQRAKIRRWWRVVLETRRYSVIADALKMLSLSVAKDSETDADQPAESSEYTHPRTALYTSPQSLAF